MKPGPKPNPTFGYGGIPHKKCTGCHRDVPLEDYYRQTTGKLRGMCKECHKARASRHKALGKKFTDEIKAYMGCLVCGENRTACLEFNHVDPDGKHHTISKILHRSIHFIFHEVQKCEVLCCNCHALVHAGELWPDWPERDYEGRE